MLNISVCPVCGGKVNKIRENWIGEYQGQKYIVPDLEYYECEDCAERIYDRDAMRKIEACSPAIESSMEKAG